MNITRAEQSTEDFIESELRKAGAYLARMLDLPEERALSVARRLYTSADAGAELERYQNSLHHETSFNTTHQPHQARERTQALRPSTHSYRPCDTAQRHCYTQYATARSHDVVSECERSIRSDGSLDLAPVLAQHGLGASLREAEDTYRRTRDILPDTTLYRSIIY